MTEDDTLREAIARWLWAMDAIPGAAWDEWPDEHAEYLSKADSYVADLPWLTPLRAQAAAADRVRELVEETWADPFGQWTAEQATAARQQKRETLRRIRRRAAALSDRPDPRRC